MQAVNNTILANARKMIELTMPDGLLESELSDAESEIISNIMASYYKMIEAGARPKRLMPTLRKIMQCANGDLTEQCDAVRKLEEIILTHVRKN